ncbi:MAG TPA: cell division protein FtsA, partial [Candidatus Hydrogenedentes bacterium]|nr:cell division protein FtsA [Candidatus Hydrogenedentota bacterium]
LNVGGNDITRALAEEFSLDFPAAEKLKRERAFAPTGDPARDGKGGEVIGRVLQRLCGEIMRSFAYFRSLPGGGQVNRIVVTGGGARLKNIVPFLRNQLGMDVRVPELLKGLTVGPGAEEIKKAPEQACAVLGMALRCVERAPLEINLIPPRIVAAARQKEQAVYWAFSILALVLSFLSVIPAAANENKLVKARIELLKQTIRAYDPELVQRIRVGSPPPSSSLVDQLNRRKGQLQTLENQVNGLDRARRQRRFWLEELSLLNDARPATGGIWFSSVETMVAEEQKPQGGGAPAAPGGRPLAGGGPSAQAGGFPGIESKLAPAPAGGGSGPGGLAGGRGAGGGGAPGQEGPPASVETVRPNGMVVQGYAESAEIITQYLDELKRTARQLPNGWYLSAEKVLFREATVQRVGWDVLYNAPADVTAGAGGGNRPGGGVQSAEGLYTFRVRVVFQRTKDRPEPPKPGDAPAEASAK